MARSAFRWFASLSASSMFMAPGSPPRPGDAATAALYSATAVFMSPIAILGWRFFVVHRCPPAHDDDEMGVNLFLGEEIALLGQIRGQDFNDVREGELDEAAIPRIAAIKMSLGKDVTLRHHPALCIHGTDVTRRRGGADRDRRGRVQVQKKPETGEKISQTRTHDWRRLYATSSRGGSARMIFGVQNLPRLLRPGTQRRVLKIDPCAWGDVPGRRREAREAPGSCRHILHDKDHLGDSLRASDPVLSGPACPTLSPND